MADSAVRPFYRLVANGVEGGHLKATLIISPESMPGGTHNFPLKDWPLRMARILSGAADQQLRPEISLQIFAGEGAGTVVPVPATDLRIIGHGEPLPAGWSGVNDLWHNSIAGAADGKLTERLGVERTIAGLRRRIAELRAKGLSIGLAPTMGALHAGHVSLVDAGRARGDALVATIFVNPTQFGPNEDFAAYPRDEAADFALLEKSGAALVFAPDVREMYPEPGLTTVHVAELTSGLCGPFRPGHFDGVATVVTKLFLASLSAKRTTSNCRSSDDWRATSTCRSKSSAVRRCARATVSPCPPATAISTPPNAPQRRRCTAVSSRSRRPCRPAPTAERRRWRPERRCSRPASARSTMSPWSTPKAWPPSIGSPGRRVPSPPPDSARRG